MKKFTEKHSTKTFTFSVPPEFEYRKPVEMVSSYGFDAVHVVKAFYLNTEGKYGDQGVAVTEKELVNLPISLTNMVKEVLNDHESISMVNSGQVGVTFYEYENKFGKQVGVEFVDLEF